MHESILHSCRNIRALFRPVLILRYAQHFVNKRVCLWLLQEEQFRLKQELAELAISLNMEAQKGRVQRVTHKEYVLACERAYSFE